MRGGLIRARRQRTIAGILNAPLALPPSLCGGRVIISPVWRRLQHHLLTSRHRTRVLRSSAWSCSELSLHHHQFTRGAKTRTTVRLEDLPQGPLLSLPDLVVPKKRASARKKIVDDVAADTKGAALDEEAVPIEPAVHDDVLVEQEFEGDGPQYPTVVMQARRNMQKFANCVLLTRVGGFYELYFAQADEYGPLLNIKVAQKKTSAGPVSMVSSLPFAAIDTS